MSDAPADQIDDFEDLYAREVEFMEYSVLSLSGDSNTAYTANVKELTCNCPDDQYNKSGAKVCKHLAKALFVARQNPDVEQHYMDRLSSDVKDLWQAVADLKQSTTAVKADAHASGQNGSQPSDDDRSSGDDFDPLTAFEDCLQSAGLDPGKFDFRIDDQYGSLQVEKDGYLDDGEFSAWQDLTEELGMNWDQNNERNYLKKDDFGALR